MLRNIGRIACCSSRGRVLRRAAVWRYARWLRIRRVRLRTPLSTFALFFLIVDSGKSVSFGCGLGLGLGLLLLSFDAPRVWSLFFGRGKILALWLLLSLLRRLMTQDVDLRLRLVLVELVSVLSLRRCWLRLLHVWLNFRESYIFCIFVRFVRAAVCFQSLSVSQGIERMVCRRRTWVDAGYHHNLRVAA